MLAAVLVWENFKDWLAATVGLSHWDLHVIVGLTLFLLFSQLMRRPSSSLTPLLPVAVLEFANETLDFLRAFLPGWYWNWPATLIEVALTLVPPLVLVGLIRAVLALRHFTPPRSRFRFRRRRTYIHVSSRPKPFETVPSPFGSRSPTALD